MYSLILKFDQQCRAFSMFEFTSLAQLDYFLGRAIGYFPITCRISSAILPRRYGHVTRCYQVPTVETRAFTHLII